jgi:hypothetical protein
MIRNITIIGLALTATTAIAGPGDYRSGPAYRASERGPRVHGEVGETEDFGGAYYGDEDGYELEEPTAGGDCGADEEGDTYRKDLGDVIVEDMECAKTALLLCEDGVWENKGITMRDCVLLGDVSAPDTEVGYY